MKSVAEGMYSTRSWYVINPKEMNIQVLRLDDIPFSSSI